MRHFFVQIVNRFLDWQADFISKHLTPQRTRRLAIVMLDISIGFFFYAPFSGEKQGVYQMSFLALLFAAIIAVIEAEKWREERAERNESP